MFWMRNKENSFPIRTLIWRPAREVITVIKVFTLLSIQVEHDPWFFADYSLIMILIDKEMKEMNLDTECIIIIFFA